MRFGLVAGVFWAVGAGAQAPLAISEPYSIPELPRLNESTPRPEAVLGTTVGLRHSRSDEITAYFRMVAASSPRVRLETHGKTPEGRDLIHAVISSPANLAKYSQGQRPNDPNGPLILWLGYGVHGNEPSASEASLPVLHALAAGEGPWVDSLLSRAIIILVPCLNPDGRDRHVTWLNANRGVNATLEAADREKTEPWPGGRTSHYWVDLNRDWLPLTQIESATRHQVWRKWHPHLTLDFHEMGTPGYFFQPGVPTRVHPLTPPENQSLTRWFAGYHARALESLRETYFFEERFDDFYPGKGSTYPDLTGSIGILFEQANSRGLRGLVGGKELRYGEAVRNQVATTFSSLRASLDGEKKLKDYQIQFYKTRPEPAWAAAQFQWRVGETNGAKLIELLQQHGVEVLARREGEVTEVAIPMDQPESRLIQAMFERRTEFTDDQFYDISTWCFDLAYGLDMKFPGRFDRKGWQPMGDPATWWPQPRLAPLPEAYAYHLPGKGSGVPRAISALLQAGVEIRVANAAVQLPGVGMTTPGDFVLRAGSARALEAIRRAHTEGFMQGARITPLAEEEGAVSPIGGGRFPTLERPRPLLVTGVDALAAGEIWQFFDRELDLPVSMVDADRVTATVLGRHSVVLLAGGSYPASLAERLGTWVRSGGRVIALSNAAEWLSENGLWKLDLLRHAPKLSGLPFGELAEERGRHALPGAIYEAELDLTHPLAYQLPKRLPVFRESNVFLKVPAEPGTVVGTYTASPRLSGYTSPEVLKLAPGAAAVLAKREGTGSYVVIADAVHFRAFFRATDRLLFNALFFGGLF